MVLARYAFSGCGDSLSRTNIAALFVILFIWLEPVSVAAAHHHLELTLDVIVVAIKDDWHRRRACRLAHRDVHHHPGADPAGAGDHPDAEELCERASPIPRSKGRAQRLFTKALSDMGSMLDSVRSRYLLFHARAHIKWAFWQKPLHQSNRTTVSISRISANKQGGTLWISLLLFTGAWWAALGSIILANIVLSGDNAVVIAMAARKLPDGQRQKGRVLGSAAAIVMRII